MAVLVKFVKDWADEHDVFGMALLSDKEWEKYKIIFKNIEYPFTLFFGTNEELEFDSENDILSSFKVFDNISKEEEDIMKKYLKVYESSKDYEFGWTPLSYIHDMHYSEQFEICEIIEKAIKENKQVGIKIDDTLYSILNISEDHEKTGKYDWIIDIKDKGKIDFRDIVLKEKNIMVDGKFLSE